MFEILANPCHIEETCLNLAQQSVFFKMGCTEKQSLARPTAQAGSCLLGLGVTPEASIFALNQFN